MADLKDINNALNTLKIVHNFRIENREGSRMMVFPPDKTKPIYTVHVCKTAFHPLRRYAEKHWGVITSFLLNEK